jgi:hypothetical protein
MVIVAMITPVDSTHSLHHQYVVKAAGTKEKTGRKSAQAVEKARFGQGDPRQSKSFPLIVLAWPWLDFARFC